MENASSAAVPPDGTSAPEESKQEPGSEYCNGTRTSRFRFKSSSSSHKGKSRSSRHDTREETEGERHAKRRHRHHHHSWKRYKTDHEPFLSPNAAFRESLFDALGDDEGAAYWESVYGQPIHIYSKPSVAKGPDGELEQMSDDEYATYVRARMWERSHQGILEEREQQRAEREKRKLREEQRKHAGRERMQFDAAIEESLKRGQKRRRAKAWKAAWEAYQQSWEEMSRLVDVGSRDDGGSDSVRLRSVVFWPVESGKRKDVSRAAVEQFLRHAPPPLSSAKREQGSQAENEDSSSDLLATLKAERVRWHPDKIQHRYKSLGSDDTVMRSVTEVFQIIDSLWNEERNKQTKHTSLTA